MKFKSEINRQLNPNPVPNTLRAYEEHFDDIW